MKIKTVEQVDVSRTQWPIQCKYLFSGMANIPTDSLFCFFILIVCVCSNVIQADLKLAI